MTPLSLAMAYISVRISDGGGIPRQIQENLFHSPTPPSALSW